MINTIVEKATKYVPFDDEFLNWTRDVCLRYIQEKNITVSQPLLKMVCREIDYVDELLTEFKTMPTEKRQLLQYKEYLNTVIDKIHEKSPISYRMMIVDFAHDVISVEGNLAIKKEAHDYFLNVEACCNNQDFGFTIESIVDEINEARDEFKYVDWDFNTDIGVESDAKQIIKKVNKTVEVQ